MNYILVVSLMVAGVSCVIEVHPMNKESQPSEWGGPMVQIITPDIPYCTDGIFYSEDNNKLFYTDRETAEKYFMNFETGDFHHQDIVAPGIEGEQVAFVYPMMMYDNKKVIGAGGSILSVEYNSFDKTYKYTPPIAISSDKGYKICKAHADLKGILYITLNSPADFEHRGGQLYKVVGHIPMKVKQYDHIIGDFTWSEDYKTMYLIGDCGRTIYKYEYSDMLSNLKTDSEQVFYKIPSIYPMEYKMSGVEMDKEGCLWITLENCGVVMQLDSSGKYVQVIPMMVTHLTGLTFGGKDNKGLLVSTAKNCNKKETGSGGIFYISGINATGIPDNSVSF